MTAQEKIWKVIRGLNSFTTEDLETLTGTKKDTIHFYLSLLIKAGYLGIVGRKKVESGWSIKIYRLTKNTGPKAPVQRRCLYDPNLQSLVPEKAEADHVD